MEKYVTLVIQFASSLVVARLITPEAFGAFSIAFSIVGFAHVIREMGVNNYLIRQPELQPHHVRAALFATGAVAWSLGLAMVALCPLIESLYGAEVRRVTVVLIVNFFIMPFGSTIFAVLQREMNFVALLRINLAGGLANSLTAVVLARLGWGVMALAWASVIGQFVTVAGAMTYRAHFEHFVPSWVAVGKVFRFGSALVLSSVLQQCSTNVATLITGRFVSLDAIGLLGRGQTVTGLFSRLIMDAVQPLVLPALATMQRTGQDLQPAFCRALDYLAVVTWPFFMFLALYAETLTIFLFGPQWLGAAVLLRLMSFGGLFWIVQPIASPLLIAVGRVDLTLRAQVIGQSAAVIGVLIAVSGGIKAVAAAGIVISAINGLAWLHCLRPVIRLSATEAWRIVSGSGLVTLVALALPALALRSLPDLAPLPSLLLGGAGFVAGWFAGVLLLRHAVAHEVMLALREMVRLFSPRPRVVADLPK
jgi:O-antigen/teichoic acid export membrane protein